VPRDRRTFINVADTMPEHPKIEGLSDGAFRALITLWCYCGAQLNDGIVAEPAWIRRTSRRIRAELLESGLVEEVPGGVAMHDYLEHNRSRAEAESLTQKRRSAGSLGGKAKADALASATASATPGAKQDAKQTASNDVAEERRGEERKEEREPRNRATRLPASWTPTVEHKQRATDEGVDLDRELVKFRAHAEETGRTSKNWNGTFTRWLMNAAEYARRDGRAPQAQQPIRGAGVWDRPVHTRPEETP
jgi:hypothetical protein